MVKDFEEFSDDLAEETLTEAAEHFFGRRKRLEEEIEAYEAAVSELEEAEKELLLKAGDLHFLLLEGEAVEDFYAELGVTPRDLIDLAEPEKRSGQASRRWALSTGGRYASMLFEAYRGLREAAEKYMHGCYYDDEEGRKCITTNYEQVRKWCGKLNEKIEKLNEEAQPSSTLAFAKRLDTRAAEKARQTGGHFGEYAENIDKALAFKPISCRESERLSVPDLPAPDKAKATIRKFGKRLASGHKAEVRRLMAEAG